MIEDEGIENVWERHALLARATRAGAQALGLELYGDPDERSNVVTAIALPDSIDGKQVPKILRDRYGITANGGQAQLAARSCGSPTAATSAASTSSPRSPAWR